MGSLSEDDRAWLRDVLTARINWIDEYCQTRGEAMREAETLDRVLAHHGLTVYRPTCVPAQTAVEWVASQSWPDDPMIEEHFPSDHPMVDSGGDIDDLPYDGGTTTEWPEGSGG